MFNVRAKYQAFHKKEKTSPLGIYVIEAATTPSSHLKTLLMLLKPGFQSSMEYVQQPNKAFYMCI